MNLDTLFANYGNAYCSMLNAGRQEAKYAATPAVEAAKQAVIDHFGGAADLIAAFSSSDRAADALDSQPTDSSMPVDMSQAKRWIVQLRGRVDTLLAIINEKAPVSSQPTDGGVRNG